MYFFFKNVGMNESNKAEVLAILEGFHVFFLNFQGSLIVKIDLINVIFFFGNRQRGKST